jgi:hypothetical protein
MSQPSLRHLHIIILENYKYITINISMQLVARVFHEVIHRQVKKKNRTQFQRGESKCS